MFLTSKQQNFAGMKLGICCKQENFAGMMLRICSKQQNFACRFDLIK